MDSDENMLSSDNQESTLSHSWDLNYLFQEYFTIGHSGFVANERNGSNTDIGEGSPSSGMLPWMAKDSYLGLGGYFRLRLIGFTLKASFWHAGHDAERGEGASLLDRPQPERCARGAFEPR